MMPLTILIASLTYGLPDPVPNFAVEPKTASARDFRPIESIDPFGWTIEDGVLMRDGRPSFWLGNGVDLGSAQATPVGLWLAKLQGASAIATPHNVGWLFGKPVTDGDRAAFKSDLFLTEKTLRQIVEEEK